MCAILELDPLDVWNFQEERKDRNCLYLIKRRGDEQRWTSDLVNYPGDIPVLQVAGSSEFRRT